MQMNDLSKLEQAKVLVHEQETRIEILNVTAIQSSITTTPQVNTHGKVDSIVPSRQNAKNCRLKRKLVAQLNKKFASSELIHDPNFKAASLCSGFAELFC